jgi:hypothetical protein
MLNLGILSYLKITGIAAVITVIGLGYWHYTSMQSEIVTLKTDLSTAQSEARQAKAAVAALELVAVDKEVIVQKSTEFRAKIAKVPDDIEIPDSLAKPFLERFGAK